MEHLPPLREVIARHRLSARKGLGQNFILDLNLTRKIVRAAGDLNGVHVIEVGPGPGGLTRALLESLAASVIVIELDSRAVAAMEELSGVAKGRLNIIEGDAIDFDIATVPAPRAIIANLPYHVASQLLIGWLKRASELQSITIMLQKEMAQRLAGRPRTPAYGRLSVMCQWLCEVKVLFDVPPSAFVPPPKVTSSIVQLVPRHCRPQEDNSDENDGLLRSSAPRDDEVSFEQMEKTVALAFSQRRKMLKGILNAAGYDGEKLMAKIDAPVTARAEELSAAQFQLLAALL